MKYAQKSSLFFLLFLSFLMAPFFVFAAEIKGLSAYTLPENEKIDGNAYVAAGDINVKGTVQGDFVAVGGNVVHTGTIEGDMTLLGGSVYSSTTIKGDEHIIGGSVKIGGVIDGDVVIAGATVEIMPDTIITGDVILLGGQVVLHNKITKKLKIIAADVLINGSLEGETDITSPTVVFGNQATVAGKVTYFSHRPARIETGAQGTEKISFNQIQWIKETSPVKEFATNFVNFWLLLQFINTLLLSFILLFVFKPFSQQVVTYGIKSFWKNVIIGLITVILVPILSVIFVASLFALPLGIILILAFAIVYIITAAYKAMIAGMLVDRFVFRRKNDEISFRIAAVGAVVVSLFHFIPFVGSVLHAILFFATIGIIYRQLFVMIKS